MMCNKAFSQCRIFQYLLIILNLIKLIKMKDNLKDLIEMFKEHLK